jgi:P-type Mg2+ transporter
VLTGESMPVRKSAEPVAAGSTLSEPSSCALMGTVVQSGTASGVVVTTGSRTTFGRIALDLGERQPRTDFQVGLQRFSMLLVKVALGSAPDRTSHPRKRAESPSFADRRIG